MFPLRLLVAGIGLFAVLAVLGCTSGSYPVDIFYEQHYQQSYKSHEPPRLAGVAGAVAYFPGATEYHRRLCRSPL